MQCLNQTKIKYVVFEQVWRVPEDWLAEQDQEVHLDQKGIMEHEEFKDQKVV